LKAEIATRKEIAPALIAATKVAALILSIRLILIFGWLGAFIITLMAIGDPTILKLVCVLLYCAGIFVPLVILCYRKGFGNGGG
jgi:hypothetical protein